MLPVLWCSRNLSFQGGAEKVSMKTYNLLVAMIVEFGHSKKKKPSGWQGS
jgi:hypothetical protein